MIRRSSANLTNIFKQRRRSDNMFVLAKFLLFIALLVTSYSLLFHFIMKEFEGVDHSWFSGVYWVLTTMTTLGFGDIVFTSDQGRFFSMIVLISGVFLLLIVLPYIFISFFIAPMVESAARTRVPRRPSTKLKDHVIICGEDPIAINLKEKLRITNQPYIFVEKDMDKAEALFNQDLPVIQGDFSDDKTFKLLNIDSAKIIFANQSDVENSHIALAVRSVSDIPIIALAAVGASKDILHFAGCNYVLPIKEILGKYLANRCMAGAIHSNILGSLENLKIVECPVYGSPFLGKTISDLKIRETTGVNIIGVWERGKFSPPRPDYKTTAKSVLLLMGEKKNLEKLDTFMSIYITSDKPIVIIGGGGVGLSVAKELDKKDTPYYLVDVKECKQKLGAGTFVQGDAKERAVLEKAGIMEAPTAVITTNDDGINGYLTLYCRNLNKDLRIVTRANFERNQNAIHKAGADFVMSYTMLGSSIVNNILQRGNLTLLTEGLHIFRYKASKALAGKTISEAHIGALTGCNVIAIQNGEELVNTPHHSTVIDKTDTLVMIGNMEQEESFKEQFVH